ncbi:MAG: hypothetical protein ACK4UK_02880 [Flavobacterium sp.]
MKKITLLAIIFLTGSWVHAQVSTHQDSQRRSALTNFNHNEPFVFMERDIEFYVFQNGDFDFNTRPFDSQSSIIFRRGNTARPQIGLNHGVRIDHDSFGRVRRVGNTFINYDAFNRVSRIGSVFMRYNRFGLHQIGGMSIMHNRNGMIVGIVGHINGHRGNQHVVYGNGTYYGPNTTIVQNSQIGGNYYYRTDGTRALVEN